MVAQLAIREEKVRFKVCLDNIDYRLLTRVKVTEKICPMCGRKFKANVQLYNPNPEQGIYCSPTCLSKANDKKLANKVSNEEFKEILKKYDKALGIAVAYAINNLEIPSYAEKDDLIQECLVALFRLVARHKRDKMDFDYSNSFVVSVYKRAIMNALKSKFYTFINDREESFWDFTVGGISELVEYNPNNDKLIDIRKILDRIFELAKTNKNVALALEKANCYQKKQDREEHQRLLKKHNLNANKFDQRVVDGTEHIFFNDMENIKNYINIYNLDRNYRFNTPNTRIYGKLWETLPIEKILEFYSGYRTCSECGAVFKPTYIQRGKAVVQCSKKCSIQAERRRTREYRLRLKQKKEALKNGK